MFSKQRRIASVLLAGALTTVSFAAAEAPANAGEYLIKNYGSEMCAAVRGFESRNNGATVVQLPCEADSWWEQRQREWLPQRLSGDSYRFVNLYSGKCLDVRDGVNADWTPVQQWECTSTPGMSWKVPGGIPAIVPTHVTSAIGGRCLDVRAGSLQEGAIIQIFHCTLNNPAQAWTITRGH